MGIEVGTEAQMSTRFYVQYKRKGKYNDHLP